MYTYYDTMTHHCQYQIVISFNIIPDCCLGSSPCCQPSSTWATSATRGKLTGTTPSTSVTQRFCLSSQNCWRYWYIVCFVKREDWLDSLLPQSLLNVCSVQIIWMLTKSELFLQWLWFMFVVVLYWQHKLSVLQSPGFQYEVKCFCLI